MKCKGKPEADARLAEKIEKSQSNTDKTYGYRQGGSGSKAERLKKTENST